MISPIRPSLPLLLALLCGPGILQADEGNWILQVGGAVPAGAASAWTGSNPGSALAVMGPFWLRANDAFRLRLEYISLGGRNNAAQTLALPSADPAEYPAFASNRCQSVSYGGEYVCGLGAKGAYLLGGAGATYLIASRSGTLILPEQAPAAFRYTANKLSPYLCAGVGFQATREWGIELRGQWATLGAQARRVDLSKAGFAKPATADFAGFTAATVSLAATFTFK